MNKKIIGICGLAGAGKDTVGDILVNNLPNWEKMSFASHLKDVASLLFGFDRKMLAGETPEDRAIREQPDKFWSEKMGKDFTPRYALQFLGTNLLRNQLHENIWVDCLEKKILESDKNIIITDVRFPNEIDMIRKLGGKIWLIERGKLPSWYNYIKLMSNAYKENSNIFTEEFLIKKRPQIQDIHPSEWKWLFYNNKWDCQLKNNWNIENLEKQVMISIMNYYSAGEQEKYYKQYPTILSETIWYKDNIKYSIKYHQFMIEYYTEIQTAENLYDNYILYHKDRKNYYENLYNNYSDD